MGLFMEAGTSQFGRCANETMRANATRASVLDPETNNLQSFVFLDLFQPFPLQSVRIWRGAKISSVVPYIACGPTCRNGCPEPAALGAKGLPLQARQLVTRPFCHVASHIERHPTMRKCNRALSTLFVGIINACLVGTSVGAVDWVDPFTARSVNGVCDVQIEAAVATMAVDLPKMSAKQLQSPVYFLRKVNGTQVDYHGLVGPIFRLGKGDKLRIHLKNGIDPKAFIFANDPPNPPDNWPHGYGVTNLHTHGLHISPKDPADNVYLELERGASHRFEYAISRSHPAGTFWYHPHKHGSVAFQLTGGMVGALIVEGDMDDLPEMPKDSSEKIFVLEQTHTSQQGGVLQANPAKFYDRLKDSGATAGSGPALRSWRYRRALKGRPAVSKRASAVPVTAPPASSECQDCDNDDENDATDAEWLFVNGQFQPTFTMQPGEIQRWRFIHGGLDEVINLCVNPDNGGTPDCKQRLPLYEIAVDGLPRGRKIKKTSNLLYPAYRWDVLFQAPPLAKGATEANYIIYDDCAPGDVTLNLAPKSRRIVARIRVSGAAKGDNFPSDERLAKAVPNQLRGLISDEEVGNRRWSLKFDFTDTKPSAFKLNGQEFDVDRIDRFVHLDTAEEWTIQSATGDNNAAGHPFHIHVNPFQHLIYEPVLSLRFDLLDREIVPVKGLVLTVDDPGSDKASAFKEGDKLKITLVDAATTKSVTSETTVAATTTMGDVIDAFRDQLGKSDLSNNYELLYDRESGRPLIRGTDGRPLRAQATVVVTPADSGTTTPPVLSWNRDRGLVDWVWRDTLLAPSKGPAPIVRMRFKDYPGKTVLHCHIVDHEDQGMMKNIFILPAGAPVPAEDRPPGERRHARRQAGAAPRLMGKAPEFSVRLADSLGRTHALAEFAGRKQILVFYLGSDCLPCLDQLRAFRDIRGRLDKQGITLIAISSSSPKDLQRTQAIVANGESLPFLFLADPELKVFKQYQLIDNRDSGLLHGIFCVSPEGRIVWQSGGSPTPYMNVVDAVNAFATSPRSTLANSQ
jgi:FtsP/CotA-like multicopper oxidase with cupredoxin domain/peroxiredoxin